MRNCVDPLDLVNTFKKGRKIYVGLGEPKKDSVEALKSALENPLYDVGISMWEAKAHFVSIAAGEGVTFSELEKVFDYFEGKTNSFHVFGAYLENAPKIFECAVFTVLD